VNPNSSADFSGRRFLIIDDEANMLLMLRKVLERDGAEVDTVSCHQDALMLAEKNRYDLTMIDVEMNEENGFTLARKIRKSVPSLKTVLMTGNPPLFSDRFEDLGIIGFLLKPLDIASLRQELQKFLLQSSGNPNIVS